MLMLTFGFVKCQVGKIGNTLEPEVAKLRKLGIPTEPNQLNPDPPVPDSDNAAPLYSKIFKAQEEFSKKNREDQKVLEGYSGFAADTQIYAAASKKYQPIFQQIENLPKFKRLDFKRDYNQGFNLLFPEYSQIKSVAKLMSPRTRYQVGRGEFDAALQSIEIQLAVARHLSEEPLLIGALVATAVSNIAYANIEFFLESIKDNQPMLAKTESLLLRYQELPNLRLALTGELVLGRLAIRSIKSWSALMMTDHGTGEPDGFQKSLDRVTLDDPAFRRMFEAKQVQTWREFFETAPTGPRDYEGYDKAMEALDQKIGADSSLENRVNQLLFPVFSQAGNGMLRTLAHQRALLLAVQLLRMRPNGLPKDLKQFGDLSIDPITHKPMGYVRKGRGFKLWTAGYDGVDNGGVPYMPGGTMSRTGTDQVIGFDIGLPKPVVKPLNNTRAGIIAAPPAVSNAPQLP